MAAIYGDWFHSRSSSNLSELLTVRKLVLESQKSEYAGFAWSGGRHENAMMYKFSAVADLQPSTMQTKIRSMMRYGFVKETTHCPLSWTTIGNLWNDLYTIGNDKSALEIYRLILSTALALFAFDEGQDGFCKNPIDGVLPLKFLLNNLSEGSISNDALQILVDGNTRRVGKNFPYWKTDLINSGLFEENYDQLSYSGRFRELVELIKSFSPSPVYDSDDWVAIRDNPLLEISPFSSALTLIFEDLISEQDMIEPVLSGVKSVPLVDILAFEEEKLIPNIDILSEDTRYANRNIRVRNSIWGTRIKNLYNFTCAVPNCDVNGKIFVVGAHIKPDNIPDDVPPHRTHILNGLCLCKNCHAAFDRGYFSLTDEGKLIVSDNIRKLADQSIRRMLIASNNLSLKTRNDNRLPLANFAQYHRNFILQR